MKNPWPTRQECAEIQRLSEKLNLPVAVGFNRRFAPATQLLRRLLRSTTAPITAMYRISDDDRVRPPDQGWKLGCRLKIEVVHIFDLFYYLFDSEPKRVYAQESRFNDALVTVNFENGSQAAVLSSSWGTMEQPKEHLEVILDRASVEMDDYVEVRTFGIKEADRVTRFAGRPYDNCDNSHVPGFAVEGVKALLELRRRYNRAFLRSGVLRDSSNRNAWNRLSGLLGDPPPPQINYAMDKGWGQSLESFCIGVRHGSVTANATAVDANRAVTCAVAARRAIETGKTVALNSGEWQSCS